MTVPVHTADGPASDLQLTVTRIRLIAGDSAFLQRRRHRKDLGSGTRLKPVADTEITPRLIPRHLLSEGHDLIVGVVGVNVVLCQRFRVLIFSAVIVDSLLNAQLLHHIVRILRTELSGIV